MYEYKIPIYIDGRYENPYHLEFKTQDEKDEHYNQEKHYCIKEYNDYLVSSSTELEDKKKKLDHKRIEFAVKVGFKPMKTQPTRWRKS